MQTCRHYEDVIAEINALEHKALLGICDPDDIQRIKRSFSSKRGRLKLRYTFDTVEFHELSLEKQQHYKTQLTKMKEDELQELGQAINRKHYLVIAKKHEQRQEKFLQETLRVYKPKQLGRSQMKPGTCQDKERMVTMTSRKRPIRLPSKYMDEKLQDQDVGTKKRMLKENIPTPEVERDQPVRKRKQITIMDSLDVRNEPVEEFQMLLDDYMLDTAPANLYQSDPVDTSPTAMDAILDEAFQKQLPQQTVGDKSIATFLADDLM